MKATTFISAEQFGHASGSASKTFLMRRARGPRRDAARRRSRRSAARRLAALADACVRGRGFAAFSLKGGKGLGLEGRRPFGSRGWGRPGRAPSPRSAVAVRVGAVHPRQMQPGRRDVLTEASEHLERVRRHAPLAGDGVGTTARVGAGSAGAWDIEPLEGDGWVDEVVAEHLQHAAAEQLLGDGGRGPIQRSELPIGIDDAGGDEGVDMRLPVREIPIGLDGSDHARDSEEVREGGEVQVSHRTPRAARAAQLTPETAWLLAQAFDTSPEFWLNLQALHEHGGSSAHFAHDPTAAPGKPRCRGRSSPA